MASSFSRFGTYLVVSWCTVEVKRTEDTVENSLQVIVIINDQFFLDAILPPPKKDSFLPILLKIQHCLE